MTEIQQLRADIATLEAAEAVFARKYGQTYQRYNIELDMIRKQLARLEKDAADPWRDHKKVADEFSKWRSGTPEAMLAHYARHLEQRVEDGRCEFSAISAHAARLLKERDEAKARITGLENELAARNTFNIFKTQADLMTAKARIAELEAELAKRAVVWCVLREGGYLRRKCGCIKTFTDRDKKSSLITQANFKPYTVEPE